MKAVLYGRFSPRPDEKTETISAQLEACRRYCTKNGVDVRSEHADEAISGAQEERDGLNEAIGALRRGDWLVVYHLDRLARDVGILEHVYARKLKRIGATLHSASRGACDDPFIRQIEGAVAEKQRADIRKKTSDAMRAYQRNGRRMSAQPPYGWKIDPEDARRLIQNPDEQAVVEIIHELNDGRPVRAIARWLNETGYQRRNGKPWVHQSVKRIIERE